MVNYSQMSACQGDMQPFEGDPYTRGRLISLRNKPQQKQSGQLSASIPGLIVSQRVQLLFDGEKCVLLLCAWKPAFLKSGHIFCLDCLQQYEAIYGHMILFVVILFHSWHFFKTKRPDLLTLLYRGTRGTVPFKENVTFTVSVSLLY